MEHTDSLNTTEEAQHKFFDSHAHYDDEVFDVDRDDLLQALSKTVGIIVNSGASVSGTKKGIEMATAYDFMYCSAGIHPHYTEKMTDNELQVVSEACAYEKTVAIGEIGLDYFYDFAPKYVQQHWFRRQLDLALEKNLPVIIHSRDAAEDTLRVIQESGVAAVGGVVHCYSYSAEMAKQYVDMGFYIGVGGVVTYKNARKLVETVAQIPLEHILIETDCPYLSPEPYRGKRNDSSRLQFICEKIAQIKEIPVDEVIRVTYENGLRLFRI